MTAPWSNVLNQTLPDVFEHRPIAKVDNRQFLPCVHPVDHYPVSLIQPNMIFGPWIAGGAVLAWYQGQLVGQSDIDVFCKDEAQARELVEKLKKTSKQEIDSFFSKKTSKQEIDSFFSVLSTSVVYQSDNATTLRLYDPTSSDTSWTIQIIHKRYFETLQDVINSFDLTVCQLGTDGAEYLLNEYVAQHIKNKELHFKEPFQPDVIKRLVKYWSYGYEPDPELINKIVTSSTDTKWTFNREQEDYENAFNPVRG